MRTIVRLALVAVLLTTTISFADGPTQPKCLPSDPTCPSGGGVFHLPTDGLQPTLVQLR